MRSDKKSLKRITRPIFDDIKLFEEEFKSALHSEVRLINMIGRYIIHHKGKLIRPILTILSSRVCGQPSLNSYKAAAMIELLHIATLIHDDVVDGAETRRAQKAARQIWGNEASVLSGYYLLSKAFHMLTTLRNLELLQIMSRTTTLMAEGEILQLTREIGSEDEDVYLRIIYLKTACLFGSAAQAGAVLAKAPPELSEALKRYGEALGMAFQIVDDALDLSLIHI